MAFTAKHNPAKMTWLTSKNHQRALILGDCSSSMGGEKARLASQSIREGVDIMAGPENKDAFWVSVLHFDGQTDIIHQYQKATQLSGKVSDISPRGSTDIGKALQKALDVLNAAPDEPGIRYLRPVTFLFTDGQHNGSIDPIQAANALKQKSDIITASFGAGANHTLLKQIATSEQHFCHCPDGDHLRNYMAFVYHTLVHTLTQGVDSTSYTATYTPE